MTGWSIAVIPFSWHLGRMDVRKKTLWALGPFRFVIHRGLSGKYGNKLGSDAPKYR